MTWPQDPRRVADPFGERAPLALRRSFDVLGARVEFLSDSAALMALAEAAYRDLPAEGSPQVQLQVELRMAAGDAAFDGEPPRPQMLGGAGVVGAAVDAHNHVLVMPALRRALVQLSPALLAHGYHARYELIEFAVFQLAARSQGLVALHAGAVSAGSSGALLMGVSGAGKSTLALHAALQGLEVVTEDGSFVDPTGLALSGVANFLHLRFDALGWIGDPALRARVLASPVIRRRSGVQKYELDLRGGWARLASRPVRLAHLVFTSAELRADGALLEPLPRDTLLARLHEDQAYAMGQPGWARFVHACGDLPGWVLHRGSHPHAGAAALRRLLMG